ncbi:MAG: site-2 protease family protein [Cyanophyceae cyanobacterium]
MNGNIRVGSLFGIPFYINPSWFLVLGLVTLTYGGQLALFPQLNGAAPWILGFAAAILLFASVLAHELGHSFVAMAQGIEVKSITLFLFGGLASLEKESETPAQSFWVAIAGPAVSILLFGVFTALNLLLPLPAPFSAVVTLLASLNLILALFNLLPGLPLDGGNILKAAVWQITGNSNQGIVFASRVGQLFGGLAVLVGILAVLDLSPVGSIWTLLIGWFLLQNAGRSAQSATVQETLSHYKAEDAVLPDSPIIPADLTLREFVNEYVIGKPQWSKFLVIDAERKLQGAIASAALKSVPTSEWNDIHVRDLVKPVETVNTVNSEQSLLDVIKTLEGQEEKQLVVVREDGVVVGLLEKASVIKLLQKDRARAA